MAVANPSAPSGSTAEGLLHDILSGLGAGLFCLDADWRFIELNRAAERHAGLSREDVLGRVFWDVAPTALNSAVGQLLREVMASRKTKGLEGPSSIRPGTLLLARAFPAGEGVALVFRDITALREAEQRLTESEARFRMMADCAPAPAWVTSAGGPIEFVNHAMAEWAGRSREELLGDGWRSFVHPEDLDGLAETLDAAHVEPNPYVYEARIKRGDGAWRLLQISSRPRFDDAGVFQGYVGVGMDVTDIRAAEHRQVLLINELNHRVKNTLATVQSLAHQTLRDGEVAREVRNRLTERLLALSAAHNVLTRDHWESAELSEIVAEGVRPYHDGRGRISVRGPTVRIAPSTALALSMALHELATNALKHGALSTPHGRVALSWAQASSLIALEWREAGGPPVQAPRRHGFGSRLLSQGLATELGAAADLDYAPDGLICRIRAPAASQALSGRPPPTP